MHRGAARFVCGPKLLPSCQPPRLRHNSRTTKPARTRPRPCTPCNIVILRRPAAAINLDRVTREAPRADCLHRALDAPGRAAADLHAPPLAELTHHAAQIARKVAWPEEQSAALARRCARIDGFKAREWEETRGAWTRAAAHEAVQARHCCAEGDTEVPEDDGSAVAEAAVSEIGASGPHSGWRKSKEAGLGQ